MFLKKARKPVAGFIEKLFRFRARNLPVTNSGRWREWSIGIYAGPSPLDLASPEEIVNPVLTRENFSDIGAEFVADPFMVNRDGIWYMFF